MKGHVFVVRGDLNHFECDAWLLPTDEAGSITAGFWGEDLEWQRRLTAAGGHGPGGRSSHPAWQTGDVIQILPGSTPQAQAQPQAWLVPIAGSLGSALQGLEAFVQIAAHATLPAIGSDRPRLLAVPVVGTGDGGVGDIAGALIGSLLPLLLELAERHSVDIALVAFHLEHWAAAQAQRRDDPERWWPVTQNPRLYEEAKRLGREAAIGNLVLFLGAGVSCGAGLPSWDTLLETLEGKTDLDAPALKELRNLGFLDRAQVLAKLLKGPEQSPGALVAEVLAPFRRYGLGHALLASMPVREVITTNYDSLFETASEDAKLPTAVLPFQPANPGARWLLKMHGCVAHPESIVLTRESYLRYADQNAALAGIVQAMLITRKMLFLGFSLTDDNFHRIVDAVRRAIHPDGKEGKAFGQAIMLGGNSHLGKLWSNQIDLLSVPEARDVDMFLDRLCCEAAQPSYLLDSRFADLLTAPDQALKELLMPFTQESGEFEQSAAWPLVHELLQKLGHCNTNGPDSKCRPVMVMGASGE